MQPRQPSLRLVSSEDKTIISTLEDLLLQAKQGNIVGFTYIAKHAPFNHSMGILGGYEENPVCGHRVAQILAGVFEARAEKMEVWG